MTLDGFIARANMAIEDIAHRRKAAWLLKDIQQDERIDACNKVKSILRRETSIIAPEDVDSLMKVIRDEVYAD